MVRRAKCYDPLHDSPARQALPGWQEIIGIRADRAGTLAQPPIVQDGMLCGACASVRETEIIADITQRRLRLRTAIQKLQALGFTDDEIDVMQIQRNI